MITRPHYLNFIMSRIKVNEHFKTFISQTHICLCFTWIPCYRHLLWTKCSSFMVAFNPPRSLCCMLTFPQMTYCLNRNLTFQQLATQILRYHFFHYKNIVIEFLQTRCLSYPNFGSLYYRGKKKSQVYYTVDNPTKNWKGGKGYISKDMALKGLPGPGEDTLILVSYFQKVSYRTFFSYIYFPCDQLVFVFLSFPSFSKQYN